MKKLTLTGIVAAAVLLTTSCSEDNSFQQQPSGDGNVTFTVQLPAQGLGSRAFADGKTANDLVYAVYDAETNAYITKGDATFADGELQTTVSLALANGKAYKIAFFAHNEESKVYTFDANATTLSVDYTKMAQYNKADHDAFFALKELPTVTGPVNETVTLTRPLAQINWGTSDLKEAVVEAAYGKDAANLQTKVEFKGVYTKFDLLTGERDEATTTDVTFDLSARPQGETFPVENYEYLSMNYILAAAESTTVDAELSVNNPDAAPVVVANMPVQANYRTNVYGALLTTPAEFIVVKEPNFEKPDYDLEQWNGGTDEEFAALIAKGGGISVNAPIANIAIPATMTENLSITLNAAVEKITFPASCDKAISIDVATDIVWPSFVMPGGKGVVKDLTITGDLSSSERCKGFDAQATQTNPGATTIENLTIKNVPFTGVGINVGFTANPQTTKNITVENCDFINLSKPAFSCSNNNYAGTEVGNLFIRNNTISVNEDAGESVNGIYICQSKMGKIEITGNTIKGGQKHGIMMDNNLADIEIIDNILEITGEDGVKIDHPANSIKIERNTIQAKEFGIRLARFTKDASPSISICDNNMDMSQCKNAKSFNAIYIGQYSSSQSPTTLIVQRNVKKVGECDKWFKILTTLNLLEGSDIETPFAD